MARSTTISVERDMRASAEAIWACWCNPERLARWIAPAPIVARAVRFEPEPGGAFAVELHMPDGSVLATEACVVDAIPARRVVFTNTMRPGFVPARPAESVFTCVAEITPAENGCHYLHQVLYENAEDRAVNLRSGLDQAWHAMMEALDEQALQHMHDTQDV